MSQDVSYVLQSQSASSLQTQPMLGTCTWSAQTSNSSQHCAPRSFARCTSTPSSSPAPWSLATDQRTNEKGFEYDKHSPSWRKKGKTDFAWWDPRTDLPLTQRCVSSFEAFLDKWLAADAPTEEHFHNLFFNLFQDLGVTRISSSSNFYSLD